MKLLFLTMCRLSPLGKCLPSTSPEGTYLLRTYTRGSRYLVHTLLPTSSHFVIHVFPWSHEWGCFCCHLHVLSEWQQFESLKPMFLICSKSYFKLFLSILNTKKIKGAPRLIFLRMYVQWWRLNMIVLQLWFIANLELPYFSCYLKISSTFSQIV